MPHPVAASVIIPTYGDWDKLQSCLHSLTRQDIPLDQFEIIVGNNNATAEVPVTLLLPANATVVWQQKPGSYAARNAAVAHASLDTPLFFTDADCLPESDWISTGLALLKEHPEISRLGGAVVLTPENDNWTVPELYDRVFNLRQDRYVARGYAATANLVVRRDTFDNAGPFNDELYSSGDKEWNRRAGVCGSSIIYAKSLRVKHGARASYAEHAKKRSRVVQGRFMMKLAKNKNKSWLSVLSCLVPSLSAAVRIARADFLSLKQSAELFLFDYSLRLLEFRTTIELKQGSSREYR